MALKDEIKDLRGALDKTAQDGNDTLKDIKEAAARTVEKGAAKASRGAKAAQDAADDVRARAHAAAQGARASAPFDTARIEESLADLKASVTDAFGQASAQAQEFPYRYPMITALGALGVGLTLGMALGRKLR